MHRIGGVSNEHRDLKAPNAMMHSQLDFDVYNNAVVRKSRLVPVKADLYIMTLRSACLTA